MTRGARSFMRQGLSLGHPNWKKGRDIHSTVFENHKKVSFKMRAKRAMFSFEWTKVHKKIPKMALLGVFENLKLTVKK